MYAFENTEQIYIGHPFRFVLDEVISWCEERFGDGAVMRDKLPWQESHPIGATGVAASFAWIMDHFGNVAFQHVDHAFEFKLRWC